MPRVMTPTVDVGMVQPGQRRAVQAIARMCQPFQRGLTVYRIGDNWTATLAPSAAMLDEADVVLLGGHEYELSEEMLEAIEADGIDMTVLG